MTPVSQSALPQTPRPLSPTPAEGPGKSAMAPGQQAKAAVAEAEVQGATLPANAQGYAASQIARGADPATVFAAMIPQPAPEPPAGDPVAPDVPVDAAGSAGTNVADPITSEDAVPPADVPPVALGEDGSENAGDVAPVPGSDGDSSVALPGPSLDTDSIVDLIADVANTGEA